jgi:hypothetical protein
MLPQTGILAVFVVVEQETTRLPVRSALFKQRTGGLVVRWVTTGESPLLNVFFFWRFVLLFALLLPVRGLIKLWGFVSSFYRFNQLVLILTKMETDVVERHLFSVM